MQDKQTTIHDIARHLGISSSTVSRALCNHPRISLKTKEIVRQTALDLNYRPNNLASKLRKGMGSTIGVIIPVINRHFFANIIHGIELIAASRGFSVIICQSDESLAKEIENIHTLIKNRVDGILISSSSESKDSGHFQIVNNSKIPLVMFDRTLDDNLFCKVMNDDSMGAYLATEHLIRQGYRKIIHFSGPLHLPTYRNRHDGYKKALQHNGLPYSRDMIRENVISREKGTSATLQLVNDKIEFDAIFAASDMSALGSLLYLKEKNIAIPEEVGIAGYVNEPFAEFIEPSLTSIEQYGEIIGTTAAEVLINLINGESTCPIQKIIDPRLIIRKSTSRVKK